MNTLFPNAVVEEDVDLEYFAIEADPRSGQGARELVAVVADVSAEIALRTVRRSRIGAFFTDRTLTARPVACPGVANPLPIEGWEHWDGPELARCPNPSCRRALASIPAGYRWSIRLVSQAVAGAEKGHGIHTCQRNQCRAQMEIVISQAPKGGNR